MEPIYFGSSADPLFGLYHPPSGSHLRDLGVLLCYSGPQEYMSCHWAFRKLALLLAREGFHVFRFDYYGTGDSAGASNAGSLPRWSRDVATAIQELKDVSGVRKVSVVAYRLGAALVVRSKVRVRDLILWEPVLDGRDYVRELVEEHERRFAHCLPPPPLPASGPLHELLGVPFPPALQEEVEAVALLGETPVCRFDRVSLVSTAVTAAHEALLAGLSPSGVPPAVCQVPEEDAPGTAGFRLGALAQREIVAFLGERA